jgi:hypothetical protein
MLKLRQVLWASTFKKVLVIVYNRQLWVESRTTRLAIATAGEILMLQIVKGASAAKANRTYDSHLRVRYTPSSAT